MKKTIITAIATLVFAGNAFADANINGFAYQLQKASENVRVAADANGQADNNDVVVGSQIIHSEGTINVQGKVQQEIQADNARVVTGGATDSTVGLQVIKSEDAINANGAVDQILNASGNVRVEGNEVENSVVGVQVIEAKGDLNVNGSAQQIMTGDNIRTVSSNANGSLVGSQVMSSQ